MKGWTEDDIPWHRFDAAKADPELLRVVKAAAVVEHNGGDYETYLHKVFADDADFCAAVSLWAQEEIRHGRALARWAALADPAFDFDRCFARFRDGYRLPLDARRSVRGSRAGELVARCVVESGTSSFYSSLAAAAEEPVLKEICRLIAADEFRHYKLFYDQLNRYLAHDRLGLARRIWVALRRVLESEDDELAFAYYCGNDLPGPYRRRDCARAYARRAYRTYRYGYLQRGLAMVLKAAGLSPHGRIGDWLGRLAWGYMRLRRRRLERAPA